nr:unnamed protein product [Callosobruchus chinensis]
MDTVQYHLCTIAGLFGIKVIQTTETVMYWIYYGKKWLQNVNKVGLRDYFRKELKNVPLPRSGDLGEEALKKSTWPHFKSLLFMKDQFLPRTSHTNLPDTADEISVTPISTPGEANGQN